MPTYQLESAIEFEDVDSYGIAHHSKLICILERARVHFLAEKGIPVSDGKFSLVLMHMDLKFLKPAKLMDRLTCVLTVESLRGASLVWGYCLKRGEDVVLQGCIKMASVDENVRPARFPDEVRSVLETILV
jgi:acyl-CoA thioester hydrolase